MYHNKLQPSIVANEWRNIPFCEWHKKFTVCNEKVVGALAQQDRPLNRI